MRILTYLLFFTFLLTACGRSDFETAMDAYHQGDYQAAFEILLPLAESGDAQAQMRRRELVLQETARVLADAIADRQQRP